MAARLPHLEGLGCGGSDRGAVPGGRLLGLSLALVLVLVRAVFLVGRVVVLAGVLVVVLVGVVLLVGVVVLVLVVGVVGVVVARRVGLRGLGGVDSGTVISVPVSEWSPVSDPSGATELRSLSEPSSCPGAGKLPVEGSASRGTPEPGQRGAVAASVVREVGRAGGAEDRTSAVAGDR